jgi:hypothetical protein
MILKLINRSTAFSLILTASFVACINYIWSIIIDTTPLDINKKQLYNRIIKTLQCERLELFLWDMKESLIISLGGKKKSISKY